MAAAAPRCPPTGLLSRDPYSGDRRLSVSGYPWNAHKWVVCLRWLIFLQPVSLLAVFGLVVASAVGKLSWISIGGIPFSRTLLVFSPLLLLPLSRCYVRFLVFLMNTFWSFATLRLFGTHSFSICHDGLAFGANIHLFRLLPSALTKRVTLVYPCFPDDAYVHKWDEQPFEFGPFDWNLRDATEAEVSATLKKQCLPNCPADVAILFLHGGVNDTVFLQEAIPWARGATMCVYCLDYETPFLHTFPKAIVTCLECLQWMKERGVHSVIIVGDAAGGGIAAYVSTICSSPGLLETFCAASQPALPGHELVVQHTMLPKVVGLVSVSGIWDGISYKPNHGSSVFSPRNYVATAMTWYCDFYWHCYRSPKDEYGKYFVGEFPQDPVSLWVTAEYGHLVDWSNMPRTLLVCGRQDPLSSSSRRVEKLLRDRHVSIQAKYFSAGHGFLAFPAGWMSPSSRLEAANACNAILEFLDQFAGSKDR